MSESTPLTATDLGELREDVRTSQYIDSSWVGRLLDERDALAAERDVWWERNEFHKELLLTTKKERDALAAQLATTTRDLEEIGQMCTQYAESDAKWADALAAVNQQLAEEREWSALYLRERNEAREIARRLRQAFTNVSYADKVRTLNTFDALHWPDP